MSSQQPIAPAMLTSPRLECWLICCEQAMRDIHESALHDDCGFTKLRVDAGWVEYVSLLNLRARMAQCIDQDWSLVRVVLPTMTADLAVLVVKDWTKSQREKICCYEYNLERAEVLDALLVPDVAVITQWLLTGRPAAVSFGGAALTPALKARYQVAFHTYWEVAEDNYGDEAYEFPLPQGDVVHFFGKPDVSHTPAEAANQGLYRLSAASAQHDNTRRLEWSFPPDMPRDERDRVWLQVKRGGYGIEVHADVHLLRERWAELTPTKLQVFVDGVDADVKISLTLCLEKQQTASHWVFTATNWEAPNVYYSAALDTARVQVTGEPKYDIEEE